MPNPLSSFLETIHSLLYQGCERQNMFVFDCRQVLKHLATIVENNRSKNIAGVFFFFFKKKTPAMFFCFEKYPATLLLIVYFDGLQPIPSDSNDKVAAAMLVVQTIEDN